MPYILVVAVNCMTLISGITPKLLTAADPRALLAPEDRAPVRIPCAIPNVAPTDAIPTEKEVMTGAELTIVSKVLLAKAVCGGGITGRNVPFRTLAVALINALANVIGGDPMIILTGVIVLTSFCNVLTMIYHNEFVEGGQDSANDEMSNAIVTVPLTGTAETSPTGQTVLLKT